MNEGVKFDLGFQTRNCLDGFLRVPMSVETFEVPDELKKAFEQLQQSFRGIGKTDSKGTLSFIEELYKHEKLLTQFIDSEAITSEVFAQI